VKFEDAIALAKSRSDCAPENIDSLVQIVNELADICGSIAECGSYRCGATIAIASVTSKQVFAFDLFGGLPYGEGAGFENFGNVDFEEIKSTVAPFPNLFLIKGRHEKTIPCFSPRPLSLIFMDSDFYWSHWTCLSYFWPMLSSEGKIVFHDWSFEGVQKAIKEVIPPDQILESGIVPSSPNMGYITKK